MNNEQLDIYTVIIVVVVAIIGTILFWVGVKKEKRVLRFCGIGFFVGAGVSLFVKSTELREILTAMAAVFAVFIAAFSIDESRRLRQDSFDRESRDRREHLLNNIIEWAIDITKWRSENRRVFEKIVASRNRQPNLEIWAHIVEVRESFVGMIGRNELVNKIAPKFDLEKVVQLTIHVMDKYIEYLDSWQGDLASRIRSKRILIDMAPDAKKAELFDRGLYKAALKVINRAGTIKVEYIR